MDKKAKPAIPVTESSVSFPVVGIGASAGGLDAFKKLLGAIRRNSGMAYILIQHMSADHESMLPELLAKVTEIPVHAIKDEIHLEPDNIYVMPSGQLLTAVDGVLKLSPKDESNRGIKTIDLFFSSLGIVHQNFAVGIVLSGADGDGTLGLKIIKANGGITFAQTTDSAAHESMPQTAIRSGDVDFILPPEKIPAKLIEINRPFQMLETMSPDAAGDRAQSDADVLKQMLMVLRVRKNVDFSFYKKTTIKRRIARRMALNQIIHPVEYLAFLREHKAEQDMLYSDLLISVTAFFRDTKSFDTLCGELLPAIADRKGSHDAIRIWVAGCATGQEAYSIAMCLYEYLSQKSLVLKIQIFATDISEVAISKARTGIYEKHELEGLSESRVEEYFTKTDGAYQVKKSIRELCIFAHHNLLKDPPFAHLDAVSCRNVLIYMEPVLQKRAMQTFHYALNEQGVLMLGKSETPGSGGELFTPYNGSDKIYLKKGESIRSQFTTSERSENAFERIDRGAPQRRDPPDFQKTADDIILSRFAPAGVVVNDALDIVQFRGATGKWLEPSPGKASLNLLKMAREGLSFELRNILHKARSTNAAVIKEHIDLVTSGGAHQAVTVEAMPLPNTTEPHFLVLFHDLPSGSIQKQDADAVKEIMTAQGAKDIRELRIEQLEKELAFVREDMSGITEEQEAVNEELQSANEELLSGSEELQSLNEELETSQEELQSTNEELNILNHELIDRNSQLIKARSYTDGILDTVRDPLITLDSMLRTKSVSSGFHRMFGTTDEDVEGRLFTELLSGAWNDTELRGKLDEVIRQKAAITDYEMVCKVPASGERILVFNARQLERVDGEQLIILSIEDVTLSRREKDELLQANRDLADRIKLAVESTGMGTWEVLPGTKTLIIDEQAKRLFGFSQREKPDYEDFRGALLPEDQRLRDEAFSKAMKGYNDGMYDIEYRIRTRDTQEIRWIKSKGRIFFDDNQVVNKLVGTLIDITLQKISEQRLKESEERFRLAADAAPAMIWLSGTDKLCTYFNKSWLQFRGRTLEEEHGNGWAEGVHPDDFDRCLEVYVSNFDARKEFYMEYRLRRHDGQYRWISDAGVPRFSPAGIFEGYVGTCIDIHEQKMVTEELARQVDERTKSLRDAIGQLEATNKNLEEFAYVASHDLQEPLRKIQTFSKMLEPKMDEVSDEKAKLYITKIKDASERMSKLIDDLLNYSRLGNADTSVPTNLYQVAQDVVRDFDLAIQEKSAVIELGPLPSVKAIPLHMNQLFHNLMSNALKFAKDGVAPVISISSKPVEADSRDKFSDLRPQVAYSHITFTDNGIGFGQKYAEKVFDIFQRLNGRSAYEGTGIGLAICRKIVKNLQGVMYVESEEGTGTSFHIILPVFGSSKNAE